MKQELERLERRQLSMLSQGAARVAGDSKPLKSRHEPLKGHEAYLDALRASGASVELWTVSCTGPLVGKIKSADKFTISLLVDGGSYDGRTMVFFKHAIESFSPVEKAV
jgi:sRNA-binding regulator protein Hfq